MARSSLAASLGLTLTFLSLNVEGRATMAFPSAAGCEAGCRVVAAGLPLPFVADNPTLSPVGSVDALGAFVLGLGVVLWGRFALALAFWSAVSAVVVWLVHLTTRRTADGAARDGDPI